MATQHDNTCRSVFKAIALAVTALTLGLVLPGCSIRKVAVNRLGDALASGGTTFASDDDPETVKAAVPFSLKLMESLLAESPKHRGLLLATTSGFTQYGYAFVQQEAEDVESKDFAASRELKARARRLYLRARDYGLRGLEASHRGIAAQLKTDPTAAMRRARTADVPLLYWTAAAWGSVISLSKDNPEIIADQIIVEALIDRALALDEQFDHGAIHTFLITYEMARQGGVGDPVVRSRKHFDRAMELSENQQAAPLLSLAESVSLPLQDRKEFQSLLQRALSIDANARPEWRLANVVMQRRARWLLDHMDDLIPDSTTDAPAKTQIQLQ